MVFQLGKLAISLLTVCILHNSVLAGSTSRIKVGLVITGITDNMTADREIFAKYTCNAAKTKITMSGFKNVEVLQCNGTVYLFSGRSDSKLMNISFNAITGKISIT